MRSQSLGRMLSFVQSTVVGGVFVLAPLVLLSIVIGHAVQIAYAMVLPIVKWMPVTSASRVSLAFFVGCVALVLACFLAGLLATHRGLAMARRLAGTSHLVLRSQLRPDEEYGARMVGCGGRRVASTRPHSLG